MKLRPHIEKLCDNIDAAVFTGDQFMEAPARARLRFFMARWEKELVAFDAFDDPCPRADLTANSGRTAI